MYPDSVVPLQEYLKAMVTNRDYLKKRKWKLKAMISVKD